MIEPRRITEHEMKSPGGMTEHEMIEPGVYVCVCVCACVCVKEDEMIKPRGYGRA